MERFKNSFIQIIFFVLFIMAGSLPVYFESKLEPKESQKNNYGQADSIEVTTKPGQVLTYLDRGKWILNFDFWLKNQSNKNIGIQSIELLVFSEKKLSYRKLMSNNGIPGALFMIYNRLPAQKDLYIFNPFYQLPEEAKPYKLIFRFNFGIYAKEIIIYPETK